jgi:hypothetical protein
MMSIQCWHPSSTHVGGDLILYAHILSENNQWFGLSKFRAVTHVHFPVDYFQEKISDHRIWFCICLIASIIIRNKIIFLIHFLQTKSYCIWRTRCHIPEFWYIFSLNYSYLYNYFHNELWTISIFSISPIH